MNGAWLSDAYDRGVLYFVFKVYFAYGVLWAAVVVPAVLALPSHRARTWVVIGSVLVWHAACCAVWHMRYHAPVAA